MDSYDIEDLNEARGSALELIRLLERKTTSFNFDVFFSVMELAYRNIKRIDNILDRFHKIGFYNSKYQGVLREEVKKDEKKICL